MEEAFISAKKHTQLAYDWETKLINTLGYMVQAVFQRNATFIRPWPDEASNDPKG